MLNSLALFFLKLECSQNGIQLKTMKHVALHIQQSFLFNTTEN